MSLPSQNPCKKSLYFDLEIELLGKAEMHFVDEEKQVFLVERLERVVHLLFKGLNSFLEANLQQLLHKAEFEVLVDSVPLELHEHEDHFRSLEEVPEVDFFHEVVGLKPVLQLQSERKEVRNALVQQETVHLFFSLYHLFEALFLEQSVYYGEDKRLRIGLEGEFEEGVEQVLPAEPYQEREELLLFGGMSSQVYQHVLHSLGAFCEEFLHELRIVPYLLLDHALKNPAKKCP